MTEPTPADTTTTTPTTNPICSTKEEPKIDSHQNNEEDDGSSSKHYLKVHNTCSLIFEPFTLFASNWQCFLTIALVASGLRALLAFIFDVVNGPNYGADYGGYSTGNEGANYGYRRLEDGTSTTAWNDFATMLMGFVNGLIVFVVSCLADGAIIQTVAEMYANHNSTTSNGTPQKNPFYGSVVTIGTIIADKALPLLGTCLAVSFIQFGALMVLFGAWIVITLADSTNSYVVMVFLGVCVMIYISIIFYLNYPAVIVEHAGIQQSLQRSYNLVRDGSHECTIFSVILSYGLFRMVLGSILSFITLLNPGQTWAIVIEGILTFGVNTFFIAITAIVKSMIYFHIRVKDESLTQEKLAAEMRLVNPYSNMDDTTEEKTTHPPASHEGKQVELV